MFGEETLNGTLNITNLDSPLLLISLWNNLQLIWQSNVYYLVRGVLKMVCLALGMGTQRELFY